MALRHAQSNSLFCHREIGGISFLERRGPGPALIFLHGIGSNSNSFLPLFQAFPKGPRLIAWNAPGYLTSKPVAAERPVAIDYARVLERLFVNLGLDRATIIGHSLGTLIAVAFASKYPERVSSIVLASSANGYGIGDDDSLPIKARDRLKDLEIQGPEAFAATRARLLVAKPEQNPSAVSSVQKEMARINPDGYAQAVHLLASGNLASSIAQLKLKPSFIIGAEDQITPIHQTHSAMRAWEEVHGDKPPCISIRGAGHAVYLEATTEFCDALFKLTPELQTSAPSHAEGEFHGG